MVVLGNSGFFLIQILKCIPMLCWKNIWERFGASLPKYLSLNLPGENYGFFSELLGEALLIWKPPWARGKFTHLCLPSNPKDLRDKTRVPNPMLRDPDQVLLKSYVLDDITVKRGLGSETQDPCRWEGMAKGGPDSADSGWKVSWERAKSQLSA